MTCENCGDITENGFDGKPLSLCRACNTAVRTEGVVQYGFIHILKRLSVLVLFAALLIAMLTGNDSPPIENESRNIDGKDYISNDSLFCTSKISFDEQIELLAAGITKYANGCYSTTSRQEVKLVDISMMSGECVVLRISDGRKLWVACESLD